MGTTDTLVMAGAFAGLGVLLAIPAHALIGRPLAASLAAAICAVVVVIGGTYWVLADFPHGNPTGFLISEFGEAAFFGLPRGWAADLAGLVAALASAFCAAMVVGLPFRWYRRHGEGHV